MNARDQEVPETVYSYMKRKKYSLFRVTTFCLSSVQKAFLFLPCPKDLHLINFLYLMHYCLFFSSSHKLFPSYSDIITLCCDHSMLINQLKNKHNIHGSWAPTTAHKNTLTCFTLLFFFFNHLSNLLHHEHMTCLCRATMTPTHFLSRYSLLTTKKQLWVLLADIPDIPAMCSWWQTCWLLSSFVE